MSKLNNNYFKSCDELNIHTFYEILKTKNCNFLRLDANTFNIDEFPIDGDDYDKLSKAWDNIHDEYNEMVGGGLPDNSYMIICEISELNLEVQIISTLADEYQLMPLLIYKMHLIDWGYNPDNMDSIKSKLQALQFRVSIIKSKNPDLFEPTDKDEAEIIEYNIHKDVVLLEDALGEGKNINVNKTVVSTWVQYIKLADRKYKKLKKNNNG